MTSTSRISKRPKLVASTVGDDDIEIVGDTIGRKGKQVVKDRVSVRSI
jgi:hypothetical protein